MTAGDGHDIDVNLDFRNGLNSFYIMIAICHFLKGLKCEKWKFPEKK